MAVLTANQVFNSLISQWRGVNNLAATDEGPFTRTGMGRLGVPNTFEGLRQAFYKECGYPETMTAGDYRRLYRRNGLFRRVVDLWPDACFTTVPLVYETPDDRNTVFERQYRELLKTVPLPSLWHQLDRCAGIDSYGGLVLGMEGKVGTDARGMADNKLNWATPYASDLLTVAAPERQDGPRFGFPSTYNLSVSTPAVTTTLDGIHWSRVVHFADPDYCEAGFLYAYPRAEAVLNYVLDATKIAGSAAEMFYKGGFQGWAYQAFPEMTGEGDLDIQSIKDNITAYQEGLQRFLAVVGGEIKSLSPNIADPSPAMTVQYVLICCSMKIPLRILLGSEASHEASSQDTGNWNRQVRRRQELVVTRYVIRATIDRLIECNVLSAPASGAYVVEWSDLNTVSELDRANIALKVTQALTQYVSGKVYKFMTFKKYLTHVVGFTDENADAVIKEVGGDDGLKKAQDELMKLDMKPSPQGGGDKGNSTGADRNRPASTTPKG